MDQLSSDFALIDFFVLTFGKFFGSIAEGFGSLAANSSAPK